MSGFSFSERFKTKKEDIFLVKGTDRDIECWYYVEVPKVAKILFSRNAIPGQQMNLEQHGRIIVSGWGEPHPHIAAKIDSLGGNYNPEQDAEWQELIILKSNIYYVQAKDQNQEEFYAYVAVNGLIADKFIEDVSRGNTNLNKYGKIIEIDWGFPSDETKQEMTEKYNVDHNHIDAVLAKAQESENV